MRRLVAVAMALLLFPSVGAAWTTYGGSAARSGIDAMDEGPFDVLWTFDIGLRIWLEPFSAVVETPHGLMAVVLINAEDPTTGEDTPTCGIIRITDLQTGSFEFFPEDLPCYSIGSGGSIARMGGYSPKHDLVLVCTEAFQNDPVLFAYDAPTGDVQWSAVPPGLSVEDQADMAENSWGCSNPAIDEGTDEVIAMFQNRFTGHNRLASLNLTDGTTNWANSTSPMDAPFYQNDASSIGGVDQDATKRPIFPGHVFGPPTVVENGILVSSFQLVPQTGGPTPEGSRTAVWFDRNGDVRGKTLQVSDDDPQGPVTSGTTSYAAAGWQDHIAVLVENTVHIVQPEVQTSVQIPTDHDLGAYRFTAPPCWHGEWLFVPLENHALILDPARIRDPVDWPTIDAGEIMQCIITPDRNVFVLQSRDRSEGNPNAVDLHDLVKIDLATGRTVSHVPLPLTGNPDVLMRHLLPLEYQGSVPLLAWDNLGRFVALGSADDSLRPAIEVDDEFPAAGDAAAILVDDFPGVVEHRVSWGDGTTTAMRQTFEASHAYQEEGTYPISVTRVFDDGRTATASTQVHYGVDDLNWLQTQFAAENQDRTWGVIGLAAVLFGAIIALVTRRIGRGRIAAGLRELAAIRSHAKDDQLAALRELQRWHGIQEDRLLHGRLTEDQFRVLEGRGARVLRSVAGQVVRPVAESLPRNLQAALEAAYRDGFVDSTEVADLREQLNGTRLAAGKRKVVSRLLDAWA